MKNLSSSKSKAGFLRICLKNFISLKFPSSLTLSSAGSICLVLIFSNFVFAEQKTAGQTIDIKTAVHHDVYGNGNQPDGREEPGLGDAKNNVVNVLDDVGKLYSRRDVYGANDDNEATNNSVNIYKGTISGIVYGAHAGVNATNNSVTITGGTVSGDVFGGNSNGNATNNSVTITGGTVSGNVYGGSAQRDNATNNSVTITGGTVSGNVYGGRADGGDATGNIVRISGTPEFGADTVICGGVRENVARDGFTNNRFIIDTKEIKVEGVRKFEYYDFYLSKNIGIGDIMLTATHGNGDKSPNQDRSLNLDKAKVDVYATPGKPLNVGDKYTLVKSETCGFSNPQFHKKIHVKQGIGVIYGSYVAVEDNKSLALTIAEEKKPNPQAKALSQGKLASMAFIEQGSQLIANKAIDEAVSSTSTTTGYAPFIAIAAGKSRYTTDKDSHIDIEGMSLAAGIAKGFKLDNCKITAGGFVEHGTGKYKSSDTITFEDIKKDVQATGVPKYTGGCLLGRIDFSNNFYTEISGKIGSAKNDFYSDDIKFYNKPTTYNYNGVYLGTHMGCGYNYEINDKLSLDTSGRYFFTHQKSKDITFPTSETIKFAGISLHKIRLGTKAVYKATENLMPYLGAAFEYEFAGKQNAMLAGFDVNASALSGASTIGELGVKWNVSGFLMDLSLRGHIVGARTGIDGMLKMKYSFGSRKKVSPLHTSTSTPRPRVPYVDPKLNNADSSQKVSPPSPKSKEIVVDGVTYVQKASSSSYLSKPKEIVIDGVTYVQKASSYLSKPKEIVIDGVTYDLWHDPWRWYWPREEWRSSVKVKKVTYTREEPFPYVRPWYSPVEVNEITYIKEEPSPKPKKRPHKPPKPSPILNNQFNGR
jgi:hypothetical protein